MAIKKLLLFARCADISVFVISLHLLAHYGFHLSLQLPILLQGIGALMAHIGLQG